MACEHRGIHGFRGPFRVLVNICPRAIGKRESLLGVRHDVDTNVEAASLWLTAYLNLIFCVRGHRKEPSARGWRLRVVKGRTERQAAGLVKGIHPPVCIMVRAEHSPRKDEKETSRGIAKEIYPLACSGRRCIRFGFWFSVLVSPL